MCYYQDFYRQDWVNVSNYPNYILYNKSSNMYHNVSTDYFKIFNPVTNQWVMWNGQKIVPFDEKVFLCNGPVLLGVCMETPQLPRINQFICPFCCYMMRCPHITPEMITGQKLPQLSGYWCSYNPAVPSNREALIMQRSDNSLTFVNESGGKSNGRFLDSRTVVATDWKNLQGKITPDLKTIKWANNTQWTRGTCNCGNLTEQSSNEIYELATKHLQSRIYVCFKSELGHKSGWYYVLATAGNPDCTLLLGLSPTDTGDVVNCDAIRAIVTN